MKTKSNLLLVIITCVLLSGCVTEFKAFKYYNKHPDQLAELCASKFPVSKTLKPGSPVITRDTVYLPGDSVKCPDVVDLKTGAVTTPKVKCPDSKTVYSNTVVRDTLLQEDTAKLKVIESKLAEEIKAKSEAEGKYNASEKLLVRTRWALIAAVIGLVVLLYGLFRK
jgi:PBP1b-binding outer membrane lipoprotein LpoB